MKRLSIAILLLTAFFATSCGDSAANKAPSEFEILRDSIKSLEDSVSSIKNCGDFGLLTIIIDGLSSDLENFPADSTLSDVELEQLHSMVEELMATMNGKWAALDCDQGIGEEELDTSGEGDGDFPD